MLRDTDEAQETGSEKEIGIRDNKIGTHPIFWIATSIELPRTFIAFLLKM
jgi:hypothetical protein